MTRAEAYVLGAMMVIGIAGVEMLMFSDVIGKWSVIWGVPTALVGICGFIGECVDALARRLNQLLEATSGRPATVQQVHRHIPGSW